MRTKQAAPQNIVEYIAGFPKDVQEILEKIGRTIRRAAPDAAETISYQMPAFTLKGYLVYFAAYKKHIGLYPVICSELTGKGAGEDGNTVPL
jgi:uncharacterized protein YdhG (YjbR/CyaY superfamily)